MPKKKVTSTDIAAHIPALLEHVGATVKEALDRELFLHKLSPEAREALALQAKEWMRIDGYLEDERRCDSEFRNVHGEWWRCRVFEDVFVVWGLDVEQTAILMPQYDDVASKTLPWIMNAEERLWMEANLRVYRNTRRFILAEEQKAQEKAGQQ